jgi:hypothetical protein
MLPFFKLQHVICICIALHMFAALVAMLLCGVQTLDSHAATVGGVKTH